MFLIDTNICIYSIKNNPKSVVQKIKSIEPYQIKVSSITVAELEYGAAKSKDYENTKHNRKQGSIKKRSFRNGKRFNFNC